LWPSFLDATAEQSNGGGLAQRQCRAGNGPAQSSPKDKTQLGGYVARLELIMTMELPRVERMIADMS
jgi:hypothetical protein